MINEHPKYQPCASALIATYNAKQKDYFAGARLDYIAELPKNPNACILEIGCGNGNTGAIAISEGKCARYCAVEIHAPAVEVAKTKITEVVQGNVETVDIPWTSQSFDALILSEVLEHLVDPWAVLQMLRSLMKPGALVFASTPNISHYKVVLMLLQGQFRLTDKGVMDRTHLRWFTPQTFREMFKSCGYSVHSVGPIVPLSSKARVACLIIGRRHEYLFWRQIDIRASC